METAKEKYKIIEEMISRIIICLIYQSCVKLQIYQEAVFIAGEKIKTKEKPKKKKIEMILNLF